MLTKRKKQKEYKCDISEETKSILVKDVSFIILIHFTLPQFGIVIATIVSLMPFPILLVNWQNQNNIERIDSDFTNTTNKEKQLNNKKKCDGNHGPTQYM